MVVCWFCHWVMGAEAAAASSLMMAVQLIPEAKPARARLLLLLEVAAAILFFFLCYLNSPAAAPGLCPSQPFFKSRTRAARRPPELCNYYQAESTPKPLRRVA